MAMPKYFTTAVTNGSGMRATSVSHGSMDTIRTIAMMNVSTVLAVYITAGPIIMRTALRSLVARDIKSPVRCCWKYQQLQPLKGRKKIVSQVVLELARRADDDSAREEPEQPADGGQHEQEDRVEPDFVEGQALAQVIDGVFQDPRSTGRDCRRHHHAHESSSKSTAISC